MTVNPEIHRSSHAPSALKALVVAALAILIATAPATSAVAATASATRASASNRVTYGIGPASATGADGRPNFSFGVTPGATIFDHVALVNYSAVPLTLQLYARDATETTGGGFGLLSATATSHGVGAWISGPAGAGTEVVPPRTATGPGQVVVPFTLKVPGDATPGDHVGGIIATLQTVGTNASGQKIILDQRVGTRVFVRVSGQIAPDVTVTSVAGTYSGTVNPFGRGSVTVRYLVSNTGNVDVALNSQSVSVSGLLADTRSVRVGAIPLLLPGSSVTESVVLPGVWPLVLLHATVTVHPLLLNGTTAELLPSVSAKTSVWALPWALIVLIVILVTIAFYLRRRRKAHRTAPARSASAKVPVSV